MFVSVFFPGRQSQLAKMTSDLCEDGGEKQREKESPASSVSPLAAETPLELPCPWSAPLSPVRNGFLRGTLRI